MPAMEMSALPPCLMVGTSVSKAWLGSHSQVRPIFSAMALERSTSKPTVLPSSSMYSNGEKPSSATLVSTPSFTRV